MIKQIYIDGVFYSLMDDNNDNDEEELRLIKEAFPDSEVVVLISLDGSNQHEPNSMNIQVLDGPVTPLDPPSDILPPLI